MRRVLLAVALVGLVPALGAQAPATARYTVGVAVQLGADTVADSTASRIAGDGLMATGFRTPPAVTCAVVAGQEARVLARVAAYPSTGAGIATVRLVTHDRPATATDSLLRRAVERADLHPVLPHRAGSDTLPAIITLLATAAPRGIAALGQLDCVMPPAGPGAPRP